MKALIVGERWPAVSVFIERQLRTVAALGIEVLVTTGRTAPLTARSEACGITPVWFTRWAGKPADELIALLRAVWNCTRRRPGALLRLWTIVGRNPMDIKRRYFTWRHALELALLEPDLIHFEWNSAAIDFEWMFDWYSCPTVISCRGRQINVWPHVPGKGAFAEGLTRTLGKTTAVHCVSQSIADEAAALGLGREKAHVIYTGVDADFFSPAPSPRPDSPSPLRLITVGALIWRKGLEYLLVALSLVRAAHPDWRLDVIGEGPEEERVRFTAADLGLSDRVHLLGRKSPVEVRDHLRRSDLFVLASLSEGIANVVIEAMACGLSVVATDCGGMREAIETGVEGLLVPPRDSAALADSILLLLHRPDLRRQMGSAGRERVLRQFDLQRQGAQFAALYRELFDGTQSSLEGSVSHG